MTRTLAATVIALASAGCIHAPYATQPCERPDLSGCIVEDVSVSGNREVPSGTITEGIATAESNHPLGGFLQHLPILGLWDRIAVEYEKLEPTVLARDLARVERIYKAQGYYEARARAARVTKEARGKVRVEIVVEEGEAVRVGEVVPRWTAEQPSEKIEALVTGILHAEAPGKPFDEARFEATKKRLQHALTNAGFAHAHVQSNAEVDLAAHRATLTYTIALGPACTFGPITLENAGDLPVEKLRQAIHIEEGQPYSTDRIEQAQGAVSDLRVVGSVDATPKLTPGATVIPVVFTVTPATLKTFKTGLGAELGSRVEVHGVAGWDNRNFFGGLRHFSVEAKPGVIVNPLTISTLTTNKEPLQGLFEARVQTELEQPGFVEARTAGLLNLTANLYQLQPTEPLGYFELTSKSGLKRDFWGARVHLGLYANVTYDKPIELANFSTSQLGNCGFNEMIIPAGQSTAVLDLRFGADGKRDPLNPHSGIYLSNDVQVAWDSAPGHANTNDVRIKPDVRGYIPIGKKVTLALRFTGGVLYTFGGALGDDLSPAQHPLPQKVYPTPQQAETCAPTSQDTGHGRYIQLLQLRGFTSGGSTSNRGYGYGGVGPQEVVIGVSPYVPTTSNQNGPVTLLPIPTGGKALWEASIELRFPLYGALAGTLFVDGSDVRRELGDLASPFLPHLSTGFGLRYNTPVGPVRADFGVRIPNFQVPGQNCPVYDPGAGSNGSNPCSSATAAANRYLDPQYGQATSVFGLPLAISLAIGEAF